MTAEVSTFVQSQIRNRISHDLAPYTYGVKEFQNMDSLTRGHSVYQGATMRVEIKDGIIICGNINDTAQRLKIRPWIAITKMLIMKMLNSMKHHMHKLGKELPDMLFYIYAAGTYPYDYQTLPLMCMAKPANRNGILIPDDTLIRHPANMPDGINWDETKASIKKHCPENNNSEKENVIFFKGSNTTQSRSGVRYYFSNLPNTKELPLKIEIPLGKDTILKKYDPLWTFCKYKYLLNLPGGQPWSYRKKFLFLLNALIIDVVLIQEFEKNNPNDVWITFFDNLFVPGTDYVELKYNWTPTVQKDMDDTEFSKMKKEITSVYSDLEAHPDKYTKMVESGNAKAKLMSMDLVYRSVYSLLIHFHKNVKRDGGPTSYAELQKHRKSKESK